MRRTVVIRSITENVKAASQSFIELMSAVAPKKSVNATLRKPVRYTSVSVRGKAEYTSMLGKPGKKLKAGGEPDTRHHEYVLFTFVREPLGAAFSG